MRGNDDATVGRQGCHDLADLCIERLDLGNISCAALIEIGRVRRIGLRQSGSDVVDIGHGIAEALPGVRVESAMVMVVVIVALGMLLVIVVVVMIVRRCVGMLLVIVVVIMTVLGMLIVVVVMPGLFGVVFVAAVIVLVVERDRLDPLGCHHAHAIEIRSVDQPIEPALELQSVGDKDRRFADGPRVGRRRLVDVRIPVGADERRNSDVLAADALYHVAEDREGGDHRGRPVGLCNGRSGQRQGEDGSGGCQKRSAGKL